MSFGDQLRRYRELAGLTQEELAEKAGLTAKAIGALERGERQRPYPATMHALAHALGLNEADYAALLAARHPRAPEASSPAPSLPASATIPATIPAQLTPLIGREAEIATVGQLLQRAGVRLLTLTGPGGVGKTSLALELAATLANQFADGVLFVALAPLADPALVIPTIARTLGLAEGGGQAPNDLLRSYLQAKQLLLVLDNFEHLLPAAAEVADLLEWCPQLTLLVTSRAPLHLRREQEYTVGPLAVPALDQVPTVAEVEQAAAVKLFVARAQQALPAFRLTPANATAVAAICRRLDGLPLALELAAARIKLLSPTALLARLDQALPLLTGGARDLPARQQTIRQTIDWSYALLSADEQRLFRTLAVFRGGCALEAAEVVSGDAGLVLDVLGRLLDQSLVLAYEVNGQTRYRLLEPMRQYAAERLASDPSEAAAMHDRHCAYYAHWINSRDPVLKGPQQHLAVAEITVEIDNLRAAWHHAIDHRLVEPLWLITERVVLQWFYELRSWYQEAEAICRRAAEALRTPPPTTKQEQRLLGNFIGNHGWFASRRGRPDIGLKLLEESLEILRPLEYPPFLFFVLEQLAYLLSLSGEFERSVALVDEALAVAQQIDDPWIKSHACFIRAAVFADRQPEIAYACFQEGLPYIRMVGDRYHLILSLTHLGEIALAVGQVDKAAESFAEALERSAEVNNGVGEVLAHTGLARVACARGAWTDAITHGMVAVVRSREVGEMSGQAKALVTLGEAEAGGGDHMAARNSFLEAIRVSLAARVLPTAIDAWLGLATLDVEAGDRSAALLAILVLVRDHPATSRHTAARAGTFWDTLAAQVDGQTLAQAERTASLLAPGHLGSLLGAYADGRAASRLDTLAMQPT